jgi:hypothetical protein
MHGAAPGDRVNAELKTWRIQHKLHCCPWSAGQLVKAVHPSPAPKSELETFSGRAAGRTRRIGHS